MRTFKPRSTFLRILWPALAGMLFAPTIGAAALTLSTTPLFITPTVAPNILVIADNSESMDGAMNGQLLWGSNQYTRGNIGRSVMSQVITNYRSVFNWGLMSFEMTGYSLGNTYAYFLGDSSNSSSGMQFTNTCAVNPAAVDQSTGLPATTVSGLTPGLSTGGVKCIPNPQPFPGGNYVTFAASGDDPNINDVLYDAGTYTSLWGLAHPVGTACSGNPYAATQYDIWMTHNLTNSWLSTDFNSSLSCWDFTPTDAGYLPTVPTVTRQLYLPRGWGYYLPGATTNITGTGVLNEAIQDTSTSSGTSITHYNNLISLLGQETNTNSAEIKNGAMFTPTRGTLMATRQYFAGTYPGYASPITSSCQKNFTVLVTDGLPTGDTSGKLYSPIDRTLTPAGGGTYTMGAAYTDAINATCALRSTASAPFCTTPGTGLADIQTYVLALGDTTVNPGAAYVMNAMASAGGTGSAYFASTPAAFSTAFGNIAASILGKIGAASSVATNSSALVTGSKIYQAKFSATTWSSDLLAYAINTTNGTVSLTPAWQGGANQWITGSTTMNQAPSARNVFTYKPSANQGIQFLWPVVPAAPTATELDVAQTNALNTNIAGSTDTLGSSRLQYLRGDASNEGCTPVPPATTCTPLFRIRPASKLGDIIDSAPAYVAIPNGGFPATLESANYAAFRALWKSRTPMLYVGANDGMLHGFDTSSGQETMAYVPSKAYTNLSKLTAPSYSHKYFVNGSPTISDVFYAGAWHTVLVGSLAQGGQSIFALDITNPANFTQSDANAQKLVLWEFTDTNTATAPGVVNGDSDLGYTLSQPAVGRVCTSWSGGTCSTSKWVAIFGNGYNNTEADGSASSTGYAYLYVVDIQNGNLLAKISTQTGSTSTPNGLASPTIVDVNGDYYIDYVYAGDLQGNMWKFDLTSNSSSWKVAYGSSGTPQPVYQALDSAGTPQPITTRPQITTHPNGTGYLVFFGTGKYLEPVVDVATTGTQTQTFYGIWDNGAKVSSVTSRNSSILQQQAIDAIDTSGNWRHTTLNSVAWLTQKGWYMDLCLNASGSGSCSSNGGEKQVSNPVLANGRIIFTTLVPDAPPSCFGGSSWIMELNFATGGRTPSTPFDVNNDGSFSNADVAPFGGTIGSAQANGSKVPGGIAGTPSLVFNPQNKTTYKYSNTSTGSIAKTDNNLGLGIGRVSWRELLNE